jgi:hypothetical protein
MLMFSILNQRQKLGDWIKKQNQTISFFKKMYLSGKDKHKLKEKGWKNIFKKTKPKSKNA